MLKNLKNLFLSDQVNKKQKYILIGIIITLSCIIYLNTFQNTFIMDDRTIFFDWPEVKNFEAVKLLEGSYPERYSFHPVFRPIKGIIHAISYSLSGNNPLFYHLQSLFVHIGICLLVFAITNILTKKSSVAFLTAILFAVHPIHTEAVTFMTASFDTAGILFFFLSFYLFLKFRENNKKLILYIVSVILATLAFLTYEITLTLPAMLIMYDICFKNISRKNIKIFFQYIPYFTAITLYLGLRSIFQNNNHITYYAGNLFLTIILSIKSLFMYLYLLLFPYKLSVLQILPGNINTSLFDENSAANFEIIQKQTLLDPVVLTTIVIFALSILAFIYWIRRKPIISFSIAWFYIALLPISNIIFPLRQVMAERFVYTASFGLILLFSYLTIALIESKKIQSAFKNLIIVFIIALITIFSAQTILRNFEYKNEIEMFKSLSKQENGGYYFKYFLGKYYFVAKEYKQSDYYFDQLSNSSYNNLYKDAYYYQALTNIRLGNTAGVKKAYKNLIKYYPNYNKERLNIIKNYIANNQENYKNNTNSKPGLVTYNNHNFSFDYPDSWSLKKNSDQLIVTNSNKTMDIFIEYNVLGINQPRQLYITDTKVNKFGTLLQEGVARIPSAEYGYIRIWDQDGTKIAHFILFNKEEIIELFAKPFNVENQKDINKIINSINFNPTN